MAVASAQAQAPAHAPVPSAQPFAQSPSGPQAETEWQSDNVAVLQGLDKITARVSRFDAPIDKPVRFGTLLITVRACVKRPPEEPPETAAFLDIDKMRAGTSSAATKQVFSGWMFASSPAISALEDPVYDVNVLDCKTETTAAPLSLPAK
ncbi:MAG: DUF2155 domain-containing protein [Alphaproteobacteria bacterium]|nr:DUF2155 domain-containing protein [Alphaproteobacteria bacterium]